MTRAICGIGRFHTYLVCDRESRPTLGVSFSSEQLPEASQRQRSYGRSLLSTDSIYSTYVRPYGLLRYP